MIGFYVPISISIKRCISKAGEELLSCFRSDVCVNVSAVAAEDRPQTGVEACTCTLLHPYTGILVMAQVPGIGGCWRVCLQPELWVTWPTCAVSD